MTIRYQSKRSDAIRHAIKRIAQDRRRFRILIVVSNFTKENITLILDAKKELTKLGEHYNYQRPHLAIGNMTPSEFVAKLIIGI